MEINASVTQQTSDRVRGCVRCYGEMVVKHDPSQTLSYIFSFLRKVVKDKVRTSK